MANDTLGRPTNGGADQDDAATFTAELEAMTEREFREAVWDYLTGDRDTDDDRIMRSDALVERTLAAVQTLLRSVNNSAEQARAEGLSDKRRALQRRAAMLRAEKSILGPLVGDLRGRRRAEQLRKGKTLEQRALEELGRREPKKLAAIRRELKAADQQET